MRDREEVCPLSRGMMLQSLSTRLQDGVCFFLIPLPAPPWAEPCGLLSPKGAIRVYHVPLVKHVGVGACYRPEDMWITTAYLEDAVPVFVTVWLERNSHFRFIALRSLSQIQIFSPYRLSSTYPAYGYQKGTLLAICTPHLAVFRYIVRAALDSGP